jgi:hypothetical protein
MVATVSLRSGFNSITRESDYRLNGSARLSGLVVSAKMRPRLTNFPPFRVARALKVSCLEKGYVGGNWVECMDPRAGYEKWENGE